MRREGFLLLMYITHIYFFSGSRTSYLIQRADGGSLSLSLPLSLPPYVNSSTNTTA